MLLFISLLRKPVKGKLSEMDKSYQLVTSCRPLMNKYMVQIGFISYDLVIFAEKLNYAEKCSGVQSPAGLSGV